MRHLRIEQFARYFSDPKTDEQVEASRENTRDKEHKTAGDLASDASSYTSGAVIKVDGGTAWPAA